DNEGNTVGMQTGDSILVPATTQSLKIKGTIELIQTYV
ncbi:MAG: mannose-6-phosphate isomerase, partial [Prevotella sp.]